MAIALQFTGGIGSEGVRAFLLFHGAIQLPFSTIERTRGNSEAGKRYFVYEIVSFPETFYGPGDTKVPTHSFSSQEEASRWRRTAAEALLVFGRDYNGFDLDPDYARLQLDDR